MSLRCLFDVSVFRPTINFTSSLSFVFLFFWFRWRITSDLLYEGLIIFSLHMLHVHVPPVRHVDVGWCAGSGFDGIIGCSVAIPSNYTSHICSLSYLTGNMIDRVLTVHLCIFCGAFRIITYLAELGMCCFWGTWSDPSLNVINIHRHICTGTFSRKPLLVFGLVQTVWARDKSLCLWILSEWCRIRRYCADDPLLFDSHKLICNYEDALWAQFSVYLFKLPSQSPVHQ